MSFENNLNNDKSLKFVFEKLLHDVRNSQRFARSKEQTITNFTPGSSLPTQDLGQSFWISS